MKSMKIYLNKRTMKQMSRSVYPRLGQTMFITMGSSSWQQSWNENIENGDYKKVYFGDFECFYSGKSFFESSIQDKKIYWRKTKFIVYKNSWFDVTEMPSMYQMNGPSLIAHSTNRNNYQTEYNQHYEGRREILKYSRVPTAFNGWKYVADRPESCHAINPPRLTPLGNPYTIRHIPTSESIRNYRRSLLMPGSEQRNRFDAQGKEWRDYQSQMRSHTADITRSCRVDLPRPKSEMTRYIKTFPYINSHCFFHPANESMRRYFVIDQNWASENKQFNIKKNNLFA